MPYCILDDLKSAAPETDLIQLTDDAGTGTINLAIVSEVITYAGDLIDGYLRSRYTLPLNPVPSLIKDIAVDLALYKLYKRRFNLSAPDGISESFKNSMKTLKEIPAGTVSLGTDALPQGLPEPGKVLTNKTSDDRVFSKDVLKGF